MVRVTWGRRQLSRTKNGENRSKTQLGCDFRVVPTHIININAYKLILINKLKEILKIPDFPENSGNSGIFPEIPDILFRNQWEVHQNGQSHKHTEFQDDRPYSSWETGGVDSTPRTVLLLKIPGQVIGLKGVRLKAIAQWHTLFILIDWLILR